MTFRFKKPPNKKLADYELFEDREFSQIFKYPRSADRNSPQNFCTATDVYYDPATLTEDSNVLDGDGKVSFELNFYINSEEALRANVRRVRFSAYTNDPRKRIGTLIDSPVGSVQYFNERFSTAMMQTTRIRGGLGFGKSVSDSGNNELTSNFKKKPPSSLSKFNNGSIKTWVSNLRISDSIVSQYAKLSRDSILSARQFINSGFNFANQTLGQNYEVEVTDRLNVNDPQAASQIRNSRPTSTISSLSPVLAENLSSRQGGDSQLQAQNAIFQEKSDPTSVFDKQYYSSGFGSPSITNPRLPRDPGSIENQIEIGVGGREADNRFQVANSRYRQTLTTQGTPRFPGKPNLESLYLKAPSLQPDAITNSLLSRVPVRKFFFRSSLKQHKEIFDISIDRLRPYVNRELYIKVELLARDGSVYRDKVFKVDLRRQLRTVMTPELPPNVRIDSQVENKIVLEMQQTDPLATSFSVYRMVARPDELDEAVWVEVGEATGNIKSGGVKFVDDRVRSNVSPNVVMYDIRCNGTFGGVCPSTKTIVVSGVKRPSNLHKNRSRGLCTIVAQQERNYINITVSRVPAGVTRIFLKRQLINTSLKKKDFREQLPVPTDTGEIAHEVVNGKAVYTFQDRSVIDRQRYRYYAQFDWIQYPRSNTTSEDYIQFRKVPDRPIVSSLTNTEISVDDLGDTIVKFNLNATFSEEGLDELNRILGDDGVSDIFVEELKKDRSLISNFLLFEVTRKNLRTDAIYTFPLASPGEFIDDTATRLRGGAGSVTNQESTLRAGGEYLYKAKLLIINPERFFREALTRIPASTRQVIVDSNPDFVRVSAAKFAENFAIQPGTIQSPTTLARQQSFREEAQRAYTGIMYTNRVDIPIQNAIPTDVRATRSVAGRPANIITWAVEGSSETIFRFRIDVTIGREQTVPLRSVSPAVSNGDVYIIRDELYVDEIVPISYSITVIYNDQSQSIAVKSNELYSGSRFPIPMLDLAVRNWITRVPSTRLADLTSDAFRSRLDRGVEENPLLAGAQVNSGLSEANISSNLEAIRNTVLDDS